MKDISNARALRIRKSGFQLEALNDDLKAQVALLDDDELAVLESVKEKLNRGLAENLKAAADTVGGLIW